MLNSKRGAISDKMHHYYLLTFKRRVTREWRAVTAERNLHRIALIKQRAAMNEKPYLAKPLLALRNFLLFKAFQSLVENINRKRQVAVNAQICTYAMYLRLTRKAFYGLRLNAAASFQKKKSKQIKRLMLQRRWFHHLKNAVLQRKALRKMQTDAAIFRFLSLQRKGLQQWVGYTAKVKRAKIKHHCALTLYYNRMCDKAFTALSVNQRIRAKKRAQVHKTGLQYLTSTSSEMQYQTRQSLNASKAGSQSNGTATSLRARNINAISTYCDDQALPVRLRLNTTDQLPQRLYTEVPPQHHAHCSPESNNLQQFQQYAQQMDGISGADNITHHVF